MTYFYLAIVLVKIHNVLSINLQQQANPEFVPRLQPLVAQTGPMATDNHPERKENYHPLPWSRQSNITSFVKAG